MSHFSAKKIKKISPHWFSYVRNKNFGALSFFLNKGFNVDFKDNYGMTALAFAIEKNQIDLVDFLLERKANINLIDDKNRNYLMVALFRNNLSIAKILIDKNIDINYVNSSGRNALHYAAFYGFKDFCFELIKRGADTTLKDIENNSFIDLSQISIKKDLVVFLEKFEMLNNLKLT